MLRPLHPLATGLRSDAAQPSGRRRALGALSALAGSLAFGAGSARAQAWPARPIRLVVPFPPGGSTDIVARLIGDKLAAALGQPVVVDNRAGAGGTTGSDVVAKSSPDGYTLLMATSSTHAIAPSLYSRLPYDAARDFEPVSLLGTATILMVVHPSLPVKTVSQFIRYARENELMFGSTGNGSVSHLTAEYFRSMTGVRLQHIPYKGDAPMTTDLIAGRVQVAFGTAVAFLPYVSSGKLVALAVTDAKPSPVAPQLPTVAASGVPGFEALQWFGLLAPAHTPAEIVARLNAEVGKALALPEVREKMQGLGLQIEGGSAESFQRFMQAEAGKWGKIVRDSGAKVD